MPDGEVYEFEPSLYLGLYSASSYCQRYVAPQAVEVDFTPRNGTLASLEVLDEPSALVMGTWPAGGGEGLLQLFGSDLRLYDPSGDLEAVTDRETQTTSFSYHAQVPHHLEGIEDPRGIQPIRDDYHPDGRLWKHTDAYNKTIEYTHDIAGRKEIIQDRERGIRRLIYGDRGNVLHETGPDGKVVVRTYDAQGSRLTESWDRQHRRTEHRYDKQGRLLKTIYPDTSFTTSSRPPRLAPGSARSRPTRYATPVRRSCSRAGPTSGMSRSFSATHVSRPPRWTPGS